MSRLSRFFTIRACVRDLSQRLAREYGTRDEYTTEEVDSVMSAWNMRLAEPAYAYALYCSRSDFDTLDPSIRAGLEYEQARRDVLARYPQLERLGAQEIAVFARSHWRSGLRFMGRTESSPLMGLPDSFARGSQTPHAETRRAIYEEPTFGLRGVLIFIAVVVTVSAIAALLLAYCVHG